jgi:hypothetical protein
MAGASGRSVSSVSVYRSSPISPLATSAIERGRRVREKAIVPPGTIQRRTVAASRPAWTAGSWARSSPTRSGAALQMLSPR